MLYPAVSCHIPMHPAAPDCILPPPTPHTHTHTHTHTSIHLAPSHPTLSHPIPYHPISSHHIPNHPPVPRAASAHGPFDLIMGGDLLYRPQVVQPLMHVLCGLAIRQGEQTSFRTS